MNHLSGSPVPLWRCHVSYATQHSSPLPLQNHNLPTYRPTYLSNFLLSHYPPYLPSHYFSQKPPLTCLPASLVLFPTSLADSRRRRRVGRAVERPSRTHVLAAGWAILSVRSQGKLLSSFNITLALLLFIFLQQILCTNPCVICINSLHYYTRNLDYIICSIFTCNLRIFSALLYPRSLPLGRSRAALLRKLHALPVCARAFFWRIVPFRLFVGLSVCLAVLVVFVRSLSPLSL